MISLKTSLNLFLKHRYSDIGGVTSSMLSRMNEESKRDLQTDDYAIPPPSPMAVDYSNISDWIEKKPVQLADYNISRVKVD